MRGLAAVLQHVPPPGFSDGVGDADVVGHDVDEHAHARADAASADSAAEALGAAARRVDAVVGDDVVAVVLPGSAASSGER